MALLKIARMGNPVLRKKTRELTASEIRSEPIQKLIQDMRETMLDIGGIGLAAPQVHEALKLAIIEVPDSSPRYPKYGGAEDLGFTVFINPKIRVLDAKEQGFWEGCLSVPGLRGLVYRPRKIEVTYLDERGKSQKLEAEGFVATVVQHELDHLEGVLYVDRIQDRTKLAFIEEYERYWLPTEDSDVGELPD